MIIEKNIVPWIQFYATLNSNADFFLGGDLCCSLGEMMTFRHLCDLYIHDLKIQNMLSFLFCFTLRPNNVVGVNSEKETGGGITLPCLRLEQLPFGFLAVLLDSFPLKGIDMFT